MYSQNNNTDRYCEEGEGENRQSNAIYRPWSSHNFTPLTFSPPTTPFQPPNHSILVAAPNETSKKKDRWEKLQVDVLVTQWRESYDGLRSANSRKVWAEIAAAVNEIKEGPERSVPQCKEKIRNLTITYKKAKEIDSITGSAAKFPPYFEELDSVLGCRDLITLPKVKQCGFKSPSTSSDRSSQWSSPPFSITAKRKFVAGRVGGVENGDADDGDDEGTEEISVRYLNSLNDTREEKKAKKKEAVPKKKNKYDELIGLQRAQLESFERAEENQQTFMRVLIKEQRQMEERERQKDRDFFFQLTNVFM